MPESYLCTFVTNDYNDLVFFLLINCVAANIGPAVWYAELVVSLQVVYSIITRFISMVMCKLVVCLTARNCNLVDVVCLLENSNMISVK